MCGSRGGWPLHVEVVAEEGAGAAEGGRGGACVETGEGVEATEEGTWEGRWGGCEGGRGTRGGRGGGAALGEVDVGGGGEDKATAGIGEGFPQRRHVNDARIGTCMRWCRGQGCFRSKHEMKMREGAVCQRANGDSIKIN